MGLDRFERELMYGLADPAHEAKLRNIRVQTILTDLMNTDPYLKDKDPEEVIDAMNDIMEINPDLHKNKPMLRLALRQYMESGGMDIPTLGVLSEFGKEERERKSRERSQAESSAAQFASQQESARQADEKLRSEEERSREDRESREREGERSRELQREEGRRNRYSQDLLAQRRSELEIELSRLGRASQEGIARENRDSQESIAAANRTSQESIARENRDSSKEIARLQRELQEREGLANRTSQEGIAAANRTSQEGISAANRDQQATFHDEDSKYREQEDLRKRQQAIELANMAAGNAATAATLKYKRDLELAKMRAQFEQNKGQAKMQQDIAMNAWKNPNLYDGESGLLTPDPTNTEFIPDIPTPGKVTATRPEKLILPTI